MKSYDNICAMATPPGGAIAIIRISGPDSINIADRLFSRNISDAKSHTLHYGILAASPSSPIDDVMVRHIHIRAKIPLKYIVTVRDISCLR